MQEKDKAQKLKEELEKQHKEKGSDGDFSIETVTSGINEGEKRVVKEKPDGSLVIYVVKED